MIRWLDAQLSPAIAVWLRMRFDLDAHAVRDLGFAMPKILTSSKPHEPPASW